VSLLNLNATKIPVPTPTPVEAAKAANNSHPRGPRPVETALNGNKEFGNDALASLEFKPSS
jgi:hypothetical protein